MRKTNEITRREFHKAASLAVAGAASGLAGKALAAKAKAQPKMDPKKVRGYNKKMGYRRLGKTNLWISEISLGGHCPQISQSKKGIPNRDDVVKNRKEVLARAHELGVNFIDTDMAKECRIYGQALRELKLRDKFHISFDNWGPKSAEEDNRKAGESMKKYWLRMVEQRLRDYGTDCLDIWRPVGCMQLDEMVAAFEVMHKAGKVRFLGDSNHDARKLKQVVAHQSGLISMVLFPYSVMTKETDNGVLAACKRKDIGTVAIKPLSAGFLAKPSATKHLKKVLRTPNLSAAIPGVKNVQQLEQNVQASYTRNVALTPNDLQELALEAQGLYDRLPPRYQWLRQWEYV